METAGQDGRDPGQAEGWQSELWPDKEARQNGLWQEIPPGGGSPRAARHPEVYEPGWRVSRFLGKGSSAEVWLVERTADGTRCALKLPHTPDRAADEFDLRRELTIRSRYRHENLLGVHGLLATASGPGLLLEYAAGDSLSRLVAVRKTLSEGEAVTVLVAVSRALACLHADGAAHGDVSPGNVLFTANGKPLLADFETGRMLGENRDDGAGTPGFTAPRVPGARDAGAAQEADVYALGALGWFMLTGRPLVPGLRPPLSVVLPGLPAELRTLLDAALDDDPALRPTAEKFAADVFRACPAAPIDLLASVHPSVRPELRTRRSLLDQGKGSRRRLRLWKRRRRNLAPWEEPRRRGLSPRAGVNAAPAPIEPAPERTESAARAPQDPTRRALRRTVRYPGRGSERRPYARPAAGLARRPGRTPVWLGAAAVVVALTAVLAGVSLLVPDALRPAREILIPASQEAPGKDAAASSKTDGPNKSEDPNKTNDAGKTEGSTHSGALGDATAGSAPTPEELSVLAGDDPGTAVRVLSTVRARAYAAGDPELLSWVNQQDSPAAEADLAQVELLQRHGERLSGLSVEIVAAERITASDTTSAGERVAVTAESSAFVQVGVDGSPTAAPGAAGRQELVLELVRTDHGWRIARVLPSAAGLEPGGSAQR